MKLFCSNLDIITKPLTLFILFDFVVVEKRVHLPTVSRVSQEAIGKRTAIWSRKCAFLEVEDSSPVNGIWPSASMGVRSFGSQTAQEPLERRTASVQRLLAARHFWWRWGNAPWNVFPPFGTTM